MSIGMGSEPRPGHFAGLPCAPLVSNLGLSFPMHTEGCAAQSGFPILVIQIPREPKLKGWSPGTCVLSPSLVGSSIQLVKCPLPVHGSPWAELRAGFAQL